MKYKILILIAIISGLIGCDDFQWELPRDNPLDNNVSASNDKEPNLGFSRYEVYEDNNNDQQINKGESIKLKVFLKNDGGNTADKVRATISCASSYISALSPTTAISYSTYSYYDYIDPGDEGYSSSYLSFSVSNTTPDGTIITFNITITDESDNTWSDSFTITVVGTGASIGFSRYEVYEDNNNDDQINKGESIKLKVFLKNNGSSTANKVRGTISCASSYISALSPTIAIDYSTYSYYDHIDPGDEACPEFSSSYLSFDVSNTTPDGTVITFNVEITDESNNTWTDSFTITVVATGASIGFSRFDVYDDDNHDQQINPGEYVKLKVYLINNGSSRANGVRGTISCSSSYISDLSPTTAIAYSTYSYYDYIDPGDEAYPEFSSYFPSFTVSALTPTGTVITFNLSITDESDNNWSDNFSITVY